MDAELKTQLRTKAEGFERKAEKLSGKDRAEAYGRAIDSYSTIIEGGGGDWALAERGRCHEKRRDWARAEADYETLVALGSYLGHFCLSDLKGRRRDPEGALFHREKGIAAEEAAYVIAKSIARYPRWARLLRKLGRHEEARKVMTAVREHERAERMDKERANSDPGHVRNYK